VVEIALGQHSLHEHRTHHAAPANDCSLHTLTPATSGTLR
jgi:hypothetical protein